MSNDTCCSLFNLMKRGGSSLFVGGPLLLERVSNCTRAIQLPHSVPTSAAVRKSECSTQSRQAARQGCDSDCDAQACMQAGACFSLCSALNLLSSPWQTHRRFFLPMHAVAFRGCSCGSCCGLMLQSTAPSCAGQRAATGRMLLHPCGCLSAVWFLDFPFHVVQGQRHDFVHIMVRISGVTLTLRGV